MFQCFLCWNRNGKFLGLFLSSVILLKFFIPDNFGSWYTIINQRNEAKFSGVTSSRWASQEMVRHERNLEVHCDVYENPSLVLVLNINPLTSAHINIHFNAILPSLPWLTTWFFHPSSLVKSFCLRYILILSSSGGWWDFSCGRVVAGVMI